ncbi:MULTISPECIES: hypothetical protein [Spirulina sp. CCY15215]|uniref:hypothetical protein n=1 Tax=Spirulina sp. CCY15215 TaxID=2767591 RepID=UPI00194E1090|nr:hypothetical protein [Spirulina major]
MKDGGLNYALLSVEVGVLACLFYLFLSIRRSLCVNLRLNCAIAQSMLFWITRGVRSTQQKSDIF